MDEGKASATKNETEEASKKLAALAKGQSEVRLREAQKKVVEKTQAKKGRKTISLADA